MIALPGLLWMRQAPPLDSSGWEDPAIAYTRAYGLPPPHEEPPMHPLVQYALKAGLTAAIAAGLVWFLAVTINTKLDAQTAKLDALDKVLATHSQMTAAMVDRLTRSDLVMERLAALMLVQCMNAAKSSGERAECARAGR